MEVVGLGVGQTVLFADVECQNGMVDVLINAGTPKWYGSRALIDATGPSLTSAGFRAPAIATAIATVIKTCKEQ